jgi:hypothetical protein
MKIRDLNFTIPPEEGGQLIQCAFAATPDLAVRRTHDQSDGTMVYQIIDWDCIHGKFEPWTKTPAIDFDGWKTVDPNEIL